MKILTTSLLISLLIAGNACQVKHGQHLLDLNKGHACNIQYNAAVLKEDSLRFEKMQAYSWARKNPERTWQTVFAKSSVQMVELDKAVSFFEIHDYHYCEVVKTDTALLIHLKQYAPYDGVILMEGINIEMAVYENDFKTQLIHWSDVGFMSKSEVYYDKLILKGKDFEKGDTVCGKLHILALTDKGKRRICKGSFNAIVR